MSADNWTHCPACSRNREKEFADKTAALQARYGSVPAEEFMAAGRALGEDIARAIRAAEETFREDYEIGVHKAEFWVDYCGTCTKCGFRHVFNRKDRLALPLAVPAVATSAE